MILRLHRIAHMLWRLHVPLLPWLIKVFNRIAFGVDLPPSARVGRNVLFSYQGLGTVIHKEAEIHAQRFALGNWPPAQSVDEAVRAQESAVLLDCRMFAALFPDATSAFERILGLPKSLITHRLPKD